MKYYVVFYILLISLFACTEQKQVSEESDSMQSEEIKMQLPTTRVGLEVDTHWGVEVRDPYRWMEDEEDVWPSG